MTMPATMNPPALAGLPMRAAHVAALVRQVAAKSSGRAILLHASGRWSGGDQVEVGNRSWRIALADTPLVIRELLLALEDQPDDHVVILTTVREEELGLDLLARVARQRVHQLQSWELVRELFRARVVDPRVARLRWLADVLLEQAPPTGYPPVASGVLDLDSAWRHLLGGMLGFPTGTPDALVILRWSVRDGSGARWRALSAEVRAGISEHLESTAGALGGAVGEAMLAGQVERLVALGLVCDVLWTREPVDPLALVAARTRLETFLGGAAPSDSVARDWADLAQRVLAELPPEGAADQRDAAESLLHELRAADLSVLSTVLPSGARGRAAAFAAIVERWLEGQAGVEDVAAAHDRWRAHADVERDDERARRGTMALRLIRALAGGARDVAATASFGDRVERHVAFSSWLDMARTALLGGDSDEGLARAYRGVLARARELRERENRYFAEALAAWSVLPNREPGVVPVEQVLAEIAAPVAAVRPVLVLVLDGLDLVVWRQLWEDLARSGWTWWRPGSAHAVPPMGVAVLPSITALSRASLFAGRLKEGNQSTEKPDFAAHPQLCASSLTGRPPVLLHKADLVEGTGNGLSERARTLIADRQQRVVGAVLNAVDDWLANSDQVRPDWSLERVPLLDALVREASMAGRAVVVASDHGHLLEQETELRYGSEQARWRSAAAGPAREGEVLVSGPRVRAATGTDGVVLLWTESLRYAARKTGYHGGATSQEVVAPIAVLSHDDLGVEGWRPVVELAPAWWEAARERDVQSVPVVSPTAPTRSIEAVQLSSTREAVAPRPATASTAPAHEPLWIAALLESRVYQAQRGLAGRTAPPDETVRAFLRTLSQSQDRVSRPALSVALGVPELRLRGVLVGIRRVLNVEGFAVVEEEEATGTVTLNRTLLQAQFGLGA